jgi:hypothetical protein
MQRGSFLYDLGQTLKKYNMTRCVLNFFEDLPILSQTIVLRYVGSNINIPMSLPAVCNWRYIGVDT